MTFFKTLIFDLDGTLVDSSAIIRKVMEAWCLKHHIPLQSVWDLSLGGRTEDTVALVAPHLCARSEAAQIEELESTTLDGLLPIAGAVRFLLSLGTTPWALVTSSSMVNARAKLVTCGMPIPKVFVTAGSVSQGKPHPEPFLVAARELGIEPEDCLVFEDADNGVNSALSAGCKVIVIGGSCSIEHPNVIHRTANFEDLELTEEGYLRMGGQPIASFTRE
jgi:mannitol-1-/sugar-/sorbitol-6-phosphatase